MLVGNIDTSTVNPWGDADTKGIVALIDRGTGTKKHIRAYDRNLYADIDTTTGRAFTTDELASTEWYAIRITITEDGFMTLYLNGEKIGESFGGFFGGKVAMLTYGVATKVSFKNLCYTEGVVSAETGDFDYIGTSIRYGDQSGIRQKSFISAELTSATVENDGFKVVEYGTLVKKVSGKYVSSLTYGADGVGIAKAYSESESIDTYFERTNDGTTYTIALYNITDASALYAFRAYYIIGDAEGNQTVCYFNSYGNTNQNVKSLKEVATQIKNAAEYETLDTDRKAYIDSLVG